MRQAHLKQKSLFNNALTAFEQATLEQLVSYKAKNDNEIKRFLQCEKLKQTAIALCTKWNAARKIHGLEPWT